MTGICYAECGDLGFGLGISPAVRPTIPPSHHSQCFKKLLWQSNVEEKEMTDKKVCKGPQVHLAQPPQKAGPILTLHWVLEVCIQLKFEHL